MMNLIKKELNFYFNTPLAYLIISVFVVVSGWLFVKPFFIIGQASMRGFFDLLPWLFMFLAPAITMASWAEEKKSGTIEILMTFPIETIKIVLAKFFSSLLFLITILICSLPIALMVGVLGNPDMGVIWSSYIGSVLLGAAYLAIGLWASSLTKNQIFAFLIALATNFLLFMSGSYFVTLTLPNFLARLGQLLGLGFHFTSIARGVLSLSDILYYVSVITFFLLLNLRSVNLKKAE
ncbi:MAG: ABC transporter permease subunit [Patescibacteria group bacterium]